MARPKVPLLDRATVIDAALDLIDHDGLVAFSVRRLGQHLGVNAASLYHHFEDKDAILHGVRLRVMRESQLGDPPAGDDTWQRYLERTASRYRQALLEHPNAAPLMAPTVLLRPYSVAVREQVAAKLLADAVPPELVHPIIDSLEMLAYTSALLNPEQRAPRVRVPVRAADGAPALATAIRAAPRSAHRLFDVQLQALIDGWSVAVERAAVPVRR
jgi:AcrR family transcriptional regulator